MINMIFVLAGMNSRQDRFIPYIVMPLFRILTVFALLLIVLPAQTSAQQCNNTFLSTLTLKGDAVGRAVVYTSSGEIVVAGKFRADGSLKYAGLLVKTDGQGAAVWARSFAEADNMELVKVKETADKGFIAVGSSTAGNIPLLWVLKTDAAGQLAWSKRINVENMPVAGKDIIELAGGGYALIANTNDSTAAANGVLARLDAAGSLLWMQSYEGAGEDGFNSLLELNGQLLVSGFVTGDLKDAFLMRADLDDGHALSVLQYSRFQDHGEEGLNLDPIPGGYSWSIKITMRETGYNDDSTYLLMIKASAAGNNYLVQRHHLFQSGGARVRNLQVKPYAGGGFVYAFDGPPNHGYPQIGRTVAEGHQEWTRDYSRTYITDFNGLDLTGNNGYVVTGRVLQMNKEAICLLKTDLYGIAGVCASNSYGTIGGGNDQIQGEPYQWQTVRQPATTVLDPALAISDQLVTNVTACSNNYCDPPPPVDNGDNCTTSFLSVVKEAYSTQLSDAVRTSDGDIVVVGSRRYANTITVRPQVIKMKPGGNIRWAKQFDPQATEDGYSTFFRAINTADNNILVVGEESVIIDHQIADSGLVMKMDYNGNVLWAKRMAVAYGESFSFVQETEDGGYIIASNENYGFPPMGNVIIKLDQNGNIVWQKAINSNTSGNQTIRAMLYDKGSIYLALDWYISYSGPNEISVVKLDAAAGDFRWARHFKSGADGESVTVLGLARIADTICVGTGLLKAVSWEDYQFQAAVVKLKEGTGEQLQGFRLNNPWLSTSRDYVWMSDRTAITFTKTIDDQLVIAHESAMNKDTTIRIHKLGVDGSLTWSRNFTQLKKHVVSGIKPDGSGLLVAGYKYGASLINEFLNEGLLMRVNGDGEIEDGAGDCASLPVAGGPAGVYITPLLLTETQEDIFGVLPAEVKATVKTPVPLDNPTLAYPSCPTFSACQAATLQGPDKICDLSQAFVYEAQRPLSCTAAPIWKIDTAYLVIVSQSAGKLTVRFKKEGSTTIKVLLDAGCKVFTTSLDVEIPKPASRVDLGADVDICKDAVIKLDAGAGFASYEWSDGSTLQTLDVTTPGRYEVTVTDKCNNLAKDEIQVRDAGNYPFSLGPDILKCRETAVTLTLPAGFGNFKWNTDYNRTDKPGAVILFPEMDTAYVLEGDRGNGCLFKDTVLVKIRQPAPIGLPADQRICPGDSVLLTVGNNFTDILWSTGFTGNTLPVNTAGQTTVSAKDLNGCSTQDTSMLTLLPAPAVALPKEPFICEGAQQVLDAGNDGLSYTWSTGATSPRITVNTAGQWWVKVTGSNGCATTDTAWYKVLNPRPQDFLVHDTLMCLRSEISIPVKGRFIAYRWSDGSTAPQLLAKAPGEYWVEVTDQYGCSGREYVKIGTKDCGWGVYVPTAFSPNNDGKNDYLRPVVMGRVTKYLFSVFDRWGTLVYQSDEVNRGWDGTVNDIRAEIGSYVWTCVYQLEGDPEKIIKGAALLIR